MVTVYVNKLIENLPENITKSEKPIKIDLILGGGAFNGSYILGALYFLKELEIRGYVIIKRISTCSISSILGLLYLTDNLDKANDLCLGVMEDFKSKGNLSKMFDFKNMIKPCLTDDVCNIINNKLYISYNNIHTFKKRTISKYNDIEHIFDSIFRSCFIPFIIDFSPCYKNKYIDGFTPYIFKKSERKRLYLDVYTFDKIFYSVNIKNEKSNYHRLLEGLLEVHKFFIKNCNTNMCSDIDRWSMYNHITYFMYLFIEKIVICVIIIICKIKTILLTKNKYNWFDTILGNILKYMVVNLCF